MIFLRYVIAPYSLNPDFGSYQSSPLKANRQLPGMVKLLNPRVMKNVTMYTENLKVVGMAILYMAIILVASALLI
jgi:hypothetical protein